MLFEKSGSPLPPFFNQNNNCIIIILKGDRSFKFHYCTIYVVLLINETKHLSCN